MPVVPTSDLPAFDRLRSEGVDVAGPVMDLPTVHVGLLNLMPDAALAATDRQFLRLVSGFSDEANLHVYPFTLAAWARGAEAQAYAKAHYEDFVAISDRGLDALIITGANPDHFELSDEPFWQGLTEVIDWADAGVQSTLCSCLATHAVLEHKAILKRAKLKEKRWGVYEHEVLTTGHPLLEGVSEPVEAPHSHWFDMTQADLEAAGVKVLIVSDEAGVHMATSPDGFSFVFFQGHPEYDDISLLKEYKREVARFQSGDRPDYPPFPDHYFDADSRQLLDAFREGGSGEFPESEVTRRWVPRWRTQGQTIYANWLRIVVEGIES